MKKAVAVLAIALSFVATQAFAQYDVLDIGPNKGPQRPGPRKPMPGPKKPGPQKPGPKKPMPGPKKPGPQKPGPKKPMPGPKKPGPQKPGPKKPMPGPQKPGPHKPGPQKPRPRPRPQPRPRPRPYPPRPYPPAPRPPAPSPQPGTVFIGDFSAGNIVNWDNDTIRNPYGGYWWGVGLDQVRGSAGLEIAQIIVDCQHAMACYSVPLRQVIDVGRPLWITFPQALNVYAIRVTSKPTALSVPSPEANVYLYR